MRNKSAKAYDAMRDSGFIQLPSARTLFDYSHYTKSALGFQPDVTKMLHEEAKKLGIEYDSICKEISKQLSELGNTKSLLLKNDIGRLQNSDMFLGCILVEYMPGFQWMKKVLPDHIDHPHKEEMKRKSVVHMLPLSLNNECPMTDVSELWMNILK
ncbi:unnamed protein product [Mytilus edulis]|uniref:Uncharacterized protein n=1 Tax=Mytilus edulis TaxID=6550 RepID=A0A8S3SVK9_MYTED|nr:unnamed protein product [Mytilus edulis]